jgi:hypothetical protein
LNIEIDTETLDALRQHAATLSLEPTAAAGKAASASSSSGTSGGVH